MTEFNGCQDAWGCQVCNKIDWVDIRHALKTPEHVSHRGIDVGLCSGKMVPLYCASRVREAIDYELVSLAEMKAEGFSKPSEHAEISLLVRLSVALNIYGLHPDGIIRRLKVLGLKK